MSSSSSLKKRSALAPMNAGSEPTGISRKRRKASSSSSSTKPMSDVVLAFVLAADLTVPRIKIFQEKAKKLGATVAGQLALKKRATFSMDTVTHLICDKYLSKKNVDRVLRGKTKPKGLVIVDPSFISACAASSRMCAVEDHLWCGVAPPPKTLDESSGDCWAPYRVKSREELDREGLGALWDDARAKASGRKIFLVFLTTCRSTWIAHISGWWRPEGDEFRQVLASRPANKKRLGAVPRTIPTRDGVKIIPATEGGHEEPHGSQSYGRNHNYSGQTVADAAGRRWGDAPWLTAMRKALRTFAPDGTTPVNACLTNWYEPTESITKHSDAEANLILHSPIFSVSWGATRVFWMGRRSGSHGKTYSFKEKKFPVRLADGDLLVMGGMCQTTHNHWVAAEPKATGPRINFTFRSFKPEGGEFVG